MARGEASQRQNYLLIYYFFHYVKEVWFCLYQLLNIADILLFSTIQTAETDFGIFITGLGRGIAVKLAELGAKVHAISRTQADLDSLKHEVLCCSSFFP